MNEEEKEDIELDIEAKYVDKTEKEFLKYMGFPENWIKITRYRKL